MKWGTMDIFSFGISIMTKFQEQHEFTYIVSTKPIVSDAV